MLRWPLFSFLFHFDSNNFFFHGHRTFLNLTQFSVPYYFSLKWCDLFRRSGSSYRYFNFFFVTYVSCSNERRRHVILSNCPNRIVCLFLGRICLSISDDLCRLGLVSSCWSHKVLITIYQFSSFCCTKQLPHFLLVFGSLAEWKFCSYSFSQNLLRLGNLS